MILFEGSKAPGLIGVCAALAWLAAPPVVRADLSMGGSSSSGAGERDRAGRTGYSELSNRSYLEREEGLALDKARRIKEAMRQMADSLPPIAGSEPKRPPVTGISDGSWYSDRLRKMQSPPSREEGGERQGLMGRIGEGLDALATKGVREDRPWEVEAPGFRPLEGLGKLASQVGESAQGLISLPQLNRTGSGGGEADRERPARSAVLSPEPGVGRQPEAPVLQAAPDPQPAGSAAPPGQSLGERLSSRLHRNARHEAPESPVSGAATAVSSAARESSAPAPQAAGAGRPERRKSGPGVGRAEAAVEPEPPQDAPVRRGGAEPPVAGRTAGPGERSGVEKFELEDVMPPTGAGAGGSRLKALFGSDEGAGGGRLKGTGHHSPAREREAAALPEPGGPHAADSSLYVVRTGEAEFFPFGSDGSSGLPLPGGTVVRVLKSGEEWSGVETVGSGRGIIRTDQLRRAREAEVGPGRTPERVAEPAKRPALPGSRIPVEIRAQPAEPVPAPAAPKPLLGDGLLPPLMDDR